MTKKPSRICINQCANYYLDGEDQKARAVRKELVDSSMSDWCMSTERQRDSVDAMVGELISFAIRGLAEVRARKLADSVGSVRRFGLPAIGGEVR